jgi:hypothetical protein
MNSHVKIAKSFDLDAARQQVEVITGDSDSVMDWRVLPESEQAKQRFAALTPEECGKKRFNFRGRLCDLAETLIRKNMSGHGIFFMPNESDGTGRKKENMEAARCSVLDMDGTPLPKRWDIEPHLINETSPGRYQCIFAIERTTDLAAVEDVSRRLAAHFGGDPAVCDITHVFRVAGFYHQKGKLFRVRVALANEFDPPHKLSDFGFLPKLPPRESMSVSGVGDIDATKAALLLAEMDVEKVAGNQPWLDAAMSFHAASNDDPEVGDLFLDWCAGDPKYNNNEAEEFKNRERWKSFRLDKPSLKGVGSLIKIARDHGVQESTINAVFSDAAGDFDGADDSDFDMSEDEPDASKPKMQRLNGLSFQLASDVEAEKIDWLWKDRFATGKINFVAGYPDQGKSQIVCDIAARVTTGSAWPNGEGVAQTGSVIMLSAEDDASDTIKPRLVAAGADCSKIAIVQATVKTDKRGRRMFNLAEDLGQLTPLLAKLGDVRLVTIDPISAYMGGKGTADTYKNTEVRAVLAPLAEWAAKHGVTVLFVSHFNKNGSGRALSRMTDSLAFGALARCGWLVMPDEGEAGEPGRKLFLRGKNNLAADAGGLAYAIKAKTIEGDIEAPYIAWGGPVNLTADEAMERTGSKATAIDLAVTFLEDVLANGPVAVKSIREQAEAKGFSWRTVQRAIVEVGITVVRKGFGRGSETSWCLPDAGEDE